MKHKIKHIVFLVLFLMVVGVSCECDTDCYEEKGGMKHNDSQYYIEFETE